MPRKRNQSNLDGFCYRNGLLYCEEVSLVEIAEELGTPVYVYSKTALLNRVHRLKKALEPLNDRSDIRFAVKACSNIHVLSLLSKLGCGADIVSAGELFRSTVAQFPSEKIIFSGVGKSSDELEKALKAGVGLFNIESPSEAIQLNDLARKLGVVANIILRVNPNVSASTHPHISTGLRKSKFGMTHDELAHLLRLLPTLKSLRPVGLGCHIGSQITSLTPLKKAWSQLLRMVDDLPFKVTTIDVGGGLGIDYEKTCRAPSLENYGRALVSVFKKSPYKILLEPGRSLTGPVAVLLTKLLHIKNRKTQSIAVLDAGMNDLLRPALYGASHPILPLKKGGKKIWATVAGPVCESADKFGEKVRISLADKNAFFAIGCAGAYGMSMASQYNSRLRAAEILVEKNTFRLIRRRDTLADLVSHEI